MNMNMHNMNKLDMTMKIDTGSATDKYPDGYVHRTITFTCRKGETDRDTEIYIYMDTDMDMETDINTDAWYGQGHNIYAKVCILSRSYTGRDIIITFRHLQIGQLRRTKSTAKKIADIRIQ